MQNVTAPARDARMRTALERAGYYERINGVSHSELSRLAFDLLLADLVSHGNTPGALQQEALMELVCFMTKYAQGTTSGRRALNLATGAGKTSAIIAWITAAYRLGLTHIPVAVAASKVDALCILKAKLLARGVPEKMIGLKHSQGSGAALPSTGDDDRLYQLITHSRVRGGRDDDLFIRHRGVTRSLMIYDETLFKSDALAVSDKAVRKSLAALREDRRGESACSGLIEYLAACAELIGGALDSVRASPSRDSRVITLPELGPLELDGYAALLGESAEWQPLRDLLKLSPYELRVVQTGQHDGLLWYQLRIPKELTNVLILDASYPIRKLVRLDDSIVCDSKYAEREVKRFDHVTVHQMLAFGGRHSVTESFRQQRRDRRNISLEVVDVIKNQPPERAILVFTFKPRPADRVDITATLKRDLTEAGIDLTQTTADGKPRFCFLTWGDETARNDCEHCETVIMAGVLHRSYLDLASAVIGQRDDLHAPVDTQVINDMLDSEIAHSVYQGMSRGACRRVDDGQAASMQLYLIHQDLAIRKALARVMPGLKWTVWEPRHAAPEATGVTARVALQISEHLQRLPESCLRMSTRELKRRMDLKDIASRTFTSALEKLDVLSPEWTLEGRSLVRATFPSQSA